MSQTRDSFNQVLVPMFELDELGRVKPNVLFHRPWDLLHSRCIEYPFAASCLGDSKCILDVGTAKADLAWIQWLENLSIEVYATDYDFPKQSFSNIKLYQNDVRKLPFKDDKFDKVFAVSVIEHIGLETPQVNSPQIPDVSKSGDLQAVRELARVLKPGGELVMTFPFGIEDSLVSGNSARSYTLHSIEKFKKILSPIRLDYYEYVNKSSSDLPGRVTWSQLPLEKARALHRGHIEGVLLSIWKKCENNYSSGKKVNFSSVQIF